jgi:hypothetical protein
MSTDSNPSVHNACGALFIEVHGLRVIASALNKVGNTILANEIIKILNRMDNSIIEIINVTDLERADRIKNANQHSKNVLNAALAGIEISTKRVVD